MTWFRRRRDEAQVPQQKRREPPPADTGGHDARVRAEAALEETRQRRAAQEPKRLWFLNDAQENHYGRDVTELFRGGKA